jgi:hypothetical protein
MRHVTGGIEQPASEAVRPWHTVAAAAAGTRTEFCQSRASAGPGPRRNQDVCHGTSSLCHGAAAAIIMSPGAQLAGTRADSEPEFTGKYHHDDSRAGPGAGPGDAAGGGSSESDCQCPWPQCHGVWRPRPPAGAATVCCPATGTVLESPRAAAAAAPGPAPPQARSHMSDFVTQSATVTVIQARPGLPGASAAAAAAATVTVTPSGTLESRDPAGGPGPWRWARS